MRAAERTRWAGVLLALLASSGVGLVGGCSRTVQGSPSGPPAVAGNAGPPGRTTPTGPAAGRSASSPARPSAPALTPVDGPCPYADPATVAGIVGQHIVRTTVTRTRPYASCGYFRPNGEQAVAISVAVLPSPIDAQRRAIALGGSAANPVDDVADGGVVRITDEGAVLAVSKGRTLVVVRINQRSSLEAREIARLVLARVGG